MKPTENIPSLSQTVMIMQIIALALLLGVTMFGAVTVLATGALQRAPKQPGVSIVGLGGAVAAVAAHLFLPALIVRKARTTRNPQSDNRSFWLTFYMIRIIIALMLFEGVSFFNLVAFIQESQWWSLATVGVLVLFMVASFPTKDRVAHWVDSQLSEL